ncbi:MAG: hypothetical protein K6E96_02040 [Bacteroidales bacterium]|nr:hypothetical protein [Bacteroidales bacterium]
MKKKVLALAAMVACAFAFNACDPDLDLVGHINLMATNPQQGFPGLEQAYVDSTALNFKSAMCNVSIDSVSIEAGEYSGTYDIHAGTVFVGTTQTLISNDVADLTYPLCGINLRDTVVGTYEISLPIDDFSFIDYLDSTDVNTLISSGLSISETLGNVFAVAVSEDAYYIGFAGNVTISNYGAEYHRVEGSVNNVQAIYITAEQIEYLVNLTPEQRATVDLAAYLPKITFNGQISSMRANIDAVMQALDENTK